MDSDALTGFGAYVAWRTACKAYDQLSPQQRAAQRLPHAPRRDDYPRLEHQEKLYRLASSRRVCRSNWKISVSVAHQTTLDGEGAQATCSHSPWFSTAIRKAAAGSSDPDNEFVHATLTWNQDDTAFPDEIWFHDEERRDIRAGKDAFARLWSSSRAEYSFLNSGTEHEAGIETPVETEIRVVACKHFPSRYEEEGALGFLCESEHRTPKEAIPQDDARPTQELPRDQAFGQSGRASKKDVGSWADPDVFSLVEIMPWLSYRLDHTEQFCYWTGLLPRKTITNDRSSSGTMKQGGERHVVIPPIVDLTRTALDEQGRQELQEMTEPERRSRSTWTP